MKYRSLSERGMGESGGWGFIYERRQGGEDPEMSFLCRYISVCN